MNTINRNYFDIAGKSLSIPIQTFSSWEEVHKEVTPEQSLDRLNRSGIAALNNRVQDLATKTAEEVTKAKRNDKEADVAYLTRVITPANFDAFQAAVTKAITAKPLKVNAKAQVRDGSTKLADKWKTQAATWIKNGKVAAINTALQASINKTYTPLAGQPADAPANILALGTLIKEMSK